MAGMIQELLLALLGYTGDVIVAEQPADTHSDGDAPAPHLYTPRYTINPVLQHDIPLTEQQIIDRVLIVGSHYAAIQQFVQHVTQTVHRQTRSMYLLALSHGLQQILQQYLSLITQIERDAIHAIQLHQQYSLVQLQVELQLYQQVFPLLIAVIREVQSSTTTPAQPRYHNCSLITLLHAKLSSTGIPQMQTTYRQLLDPLLQLLYKQLSEWVLHGELYDPYRELFIHLNSPGASSSQQKQGNALTETPIINQSSMAGSTFNWNTDYTLLLQRVPTDYVSVSTANKLLFAGKAVHVLKRAAADQHQKREKQHAHTYMHHEVFPECQLFVQQLQHHATTNHAQSTAAQSLHVEFITETLRTAISKRLYQLVVNDSNLRMHLSTLRQFYLLHAGEFYRTFIQQFNSLTQRPPTVRAEKDLQHSCWLHSAVVTKLEDNAYWKHVTLKFEPSSFSYNHFKLADVVDNTSQASGSAGFVCVGAAKLAKQQQLYALQLLKPSSKLSYGFVSYSNRRYIAAGFETSYTLCSSYQPANEVQAASSNRCGFACVLANTLPPCPISAAPTTSSSSLFQHGSMPNALTIEFSLGNAGAQLQVYHHGLTADAVQRIATADIESNTLFQSELQAHNIVIQHTTSDNMLTATIDDKQLLRVECKIRNLLQLDGGRAYMSVVAIDATSGDAAKRLNVSITGWHFKEMNAATHPDSEATTVSTTAKHALGWRNLSLAYNIQSPLDLIIQPTTIDRYNSLFRMLFTLKRVQSELQATWSQLSSSKQHSRMEDLSHQQPTHPQLLQLRAAMQFFVDTLLTHLHVDILDVHYTKLLELLDTLTEFEAVVNAHDQYLNTLISKCFLRDRLLLTTIESLADACLAFCSLIAAMGADTPKQHRPTQLQLFQRYSTIVHEWQTNLSFFFTVAARQTTNWSASSLATLIIRLDFNSWFSDAITTVTTLRKQAAKDDTVDSKENASEQKTHESTRPTSAYRPTPQTSMSAERSQPAYPLQTPLTVAPAGKQPPVVMQPYRYTPASQVTSVFGGRFNPPPAPQQPSLSPDDQLLFSPVRK